MTEQQIRDEAERILEKNIPRWKGQRRIYQHEHCIAAMEEFCQWLLSQQGEGKGMDEMDIIHRKQDITAQVAKCIQEISKLSGMIFQSSSNPPEVKGVATGIPHGVTQSTPGSYPEGSPKWSAGVSPDSTSQPKPEKTAEEIAIKWSYAWARSANPKMNVRAAIDFALEEYASQSPSLRDALEKMVKYFDKHILAHYDREGYDLNEQAKAALNNNTDKKQENEMDR